MARLTYTSGPPLKDRAKVKIKHKDRCKYQRLFWLSAFLNAVAIAVLMHRGGI